MSKETRFWTVLALFATIVGVWISYRQLILAIEPKMESQKQMIVRQKSLSATTKTSTIDDFLTNKPSRYATIVSDKSNFELIQFIDTSSFRILPNNIIVAETFAVWNGSIYQNHKYTIWVQRFNCTEKSYTRLSEKSYDERNILRNEMGDDDSIVFDVSNQTESILDFVCMPGIQRNYISVYLRYWRYLPDNADPVDVANKMFSAMGRRSGH
jgi:hypothetical protein